MRKRSFMWASALALAIAAAGGMARAQTSASKCDGKPSYLVSGACTYCEWGGACGKCQIKGCTTQEEQQETGGL